MDANELASRFGYHPPSTPDVVEAHELVRRLFGNLAETLNKLIPDGRSKAQAMTALDDGCMYANAAIARSQLGS